MSNPSAKDLDSAELESATEMLLSLMHVEAGRSGSDRIFDEVTGTYLQLVDHSSLPDSQHRSEPEVYPDDPNLELERARTTLAGIIAQLTGMCSDTLGAEELNAKHQALVVETLHNLKTDTEERIRHLLSLVEEGK